MRESDRETEKERERETEREISWIFPLGNVIPPPRPGVKYYKSSKKHNKNTSSL